MNFRNKIVVRLEKQALIDADNAIQLAADKLESLNPRLAPGVRNKDKTFIQKAIEFFRQTAPQVQPNEQVWYNNVANALENYFPSRPTTASFSKMAEEIPATSSVIPTQPRQKIPYEVWIKSKKSDGTSYEQWAKRVDKLVSKQYGLGMDDFPDWRSMDAYESNKTVEQGFRAFKRAQGSELMMDEQLEMPKPKSIAVYYEVVTHESAQQGDAEERGEEETLVYDPEDESPIAWAVGEISKYGYVEYSESHPNFEGGYQGWYTTTDAVENYQTGDMTSYSLHLKGFTPEEQKQVFEAIGRKQGRVASMNFRKKILDKIAADERLSMKPSVEDLMSNFDQVQSAGQKLNAYKHKKSGEIINLMNGTWRVHRKDGSKGSLGNGEDMYRYEHLDEALRDVNQRASQDEYVD